MLGWYLVVNHTRIVDFRAISGAWTRSGAGSSHGPVALSTYQSTGTWCSALEPITQVRGILIGVAYLLQYDTSTVEE